MLELARNDLRSRYLGSYLGIVWAFVQPVATVLVLWIAFTFGFRTGEMDGHPFVLWLISGLVAWNFFGDSLSSGTQAVLEHGYLVKKMVFKSSILPLVKVISSLVVHLIFVGVAIALLAVGGHPPSAYLLQLPLLIGLVFLLALGLSWFSSSVVVFCRDLSQVIQLTLQMLFWLTPIIWTLSLVPEKHQLWFKFNPLTGIILGYRYALLGEGWVWDLGSSALVAPLCAVASLFLGAWVFSKLQPHFPDVV